MRREKISHSHQVFKRVIDQVRPMRCQIASFSEEVIKVGCFDSRNLDLLIIVSFKRLNDHLISQLGEKPEMETN